MVCTALGDQIGQNFTMWVIFRGSGIFWWKYDLFEVFHVELWRRYFGIFGFGNCFGYFFQNLGDFFPNFWSPCLYYKNMTIINGDCKCCHKLDHDSWVTIMLLESSIMLLESSIMLLESSGGQRYSDTSPFSIPWINRWSCVSFSYQFRRDGVDVDDAVCRISKQNVDVTPSRNILGF